MPPRHWFTICIKKGLSASTPGAPGWLMPLLVPIEFITQIVIRPITLSVRLWANFLAGHFLLAVFFLCTIATLQPR